MPTSRMRRANITVDQARFKADAIGHDLYTHEEHAELLLENLRARQQEVALYLTNIDNYQAAAAAQPRGSDLRAEYEQRVQDELGQLEKALTIAEAVKSKVDALPASVRQQARQRLGQLVAAQRAQRLEAKQER